MGFLYTATATHRLHLHSKYLTNLSQCVCQAWAVEGLRDSFVLALYLLPATNMLWCCYFGAGHLLT